MTQAREQGLEALRTGRFAEAFDAFRRAATDGDEEARAYLGLLHLRGLGTPYDPDMAFRHTERAYGAGVVHAGLTLASLLYGGRGTSRDAARALEILHETASRGYPPALRILGLFHLGERRARAAASLIAAAARAGDAFSLHASAVLAFARGEPREAVPLLVAAARQGLPPARQRLRLFQKEQGPQRTRELALLPPAWPPVDLREALAAPLEPASLPPPATRLLASAIGLRHARGVLHPVECDYLFALAAPFLRPAETTDPRDGRAHATPLRTSLATNLHPSQEDLLALRIEEKILDVLKRGTDGDTPLGLERTEPLAILHYAPGQEYRPHYDAYPPSALERQDGLACAGQRTHTLLTYLNDACEGGETHFPRLGLRIAPETGTVVLFRNSDERGLPLDESLHAGEPVLSGEKWLATLWVREREGARRLPKAEGRGT